MNTGIVCTIRLLGCSIRLVSYSFSSVIIDASKRGVLQECNRVIPCVFDWCSSYDCNVCW